MMDPLLRNVAHTCARKVAYSDKATAKQAAKKFFKKTPVRQRPYECQICGAWHLTSTPLERMEDLSRKLSERLA